MSYLRDKLPELSPPVVERVFTPDLKGLVAWLETKDGAQEYDGFDCRRCLLCQFASAIVGRPLYYSQAIAELGMEIGKQYPLKHIAHDSGSTFGAALSRARQALTEAK